jgi:glycosyltransferase involved in cell wall biosynthesis
LSRSATPRAVIAAPLYNKADYLPLTLDSLLAQDYREFALLLVDDCSTDSTGEICAAYAKDARVRYMRNQTRLGMIGNRRRCFDVAQELFPASPYFAWGSDHDIWRPRWLSALVDALDNHADAVLAYSQTVRIDGNGTVVRRPWEFDTRSITARRRRLQLSCGGGTGLGDSVYGLYRADALARAGVTRYVLNPDRLLMAELALRGQFVQVPEILWERRFVGLASLARQRAAFFPGGAPWYSRVPPWYTHVGVFFARYVVAGAGRPEIGRTRALGFTLEFLRSTALYRTQRRALHLRRAARRHRRRVAAGRA